MCEKPVESNVVQSSDAPTVKDPSLYTPDGLRLARLQQEGPAGAVARVLTRNNRK